MDIVICDEEGRENTRGVEVVEKLPPVRVRGVSKERGVCVLCARVDGKESKKGESAQSNCESMLRLVPLFHIFGPKDHLDYVIIPQPSHAEPIRGLGHSHRRNVEYPNANAYKKQHKARAKVSSYITHA